MQLGEPVEVPGIEVTEAGADVELERVGLPRPYRVPLGRRCLRPGDAVAAQLLAQLVGQRRGSAVVAHVHARRLAGGHALVAGEHAVAVAHRRAADPAHPDADAVVPDDSQRSEDVDAHRDEPQAHQAVRPVLEVRVERLAAQLHAGVLEPAHERVAADAAARVEVAVLRGVLEEHGETATTHSGRCRWRSRDDDDKSGRVAPHTPVRTSHAGDVRARPSRPDVQPRGSCGGKSGWRCTSRHSPSTRRRMCVTRRVMRAGGPASIRTSVSS